MICPNCGKEIPSNAKFCPICGNAICDQQQLPGQDAIETSAAGNMWEKEGAVPRKSRGLKATIGIGLILIAVAAIFIVRAVNERKMFNGLPQAIFNESEEIVQTFYDDYLGERNNRMIGYKADDFRFEKGAQPNTFDLYGVIEVTDIIAQERPVYRVALKGTVTTNFFRQNTSVTWDFDYEIPEPRITYDTIAGYYVAGPTNSYIYPTLGIIIEGSTLNIWESTYGGGEGSFDEVFSSESIWPKIENNSLKFTAKEMYWDETYNLTLEFVPASKSSNGVDTIYLKGSERFDAYSFYRVESLYEDDNEYDNPGGEPTLFADMREVGRAFENNAFSAKSTYGGQCIAVTGTVHSISTSGTSVTVELKYENIYSNEWYYANFTFDESTSYALYSISKGQTVTIAGYLDEVWGTSSIYFKDCYLLN